MQKPPPLAKILIPWFDQNKQDLPWRRTRDPYKIWVSEIMLQQTQVATVISYYERWTAAFPTVQSLAGAHIDKVLKLWEGLGYYQRARNLHKAAQIIVEKHGGGFPSDFEEVLALPGIGRYTAGAILSIAFDKPYPLLDGNVIRVFSRLFALAEPADSPKAQKKLWELTELLVPRKRAGDYNQALMELGRTVCTPRQPSCLVCPLSALCEARKLGKEEFFPVKGRKMEIKKVRAVCALVLKDGKVMIMKRPDGGLWAGLWEFPTFRLAEGEKPAEFLEKALGKIGVRAAVGGKKASLKRAYTDHQEDMEIYECKFAGKTRAAETELAWAKTRDLSKYTLPSACKKIIEKCL